ncbi:MAG TPA: SDR family oxidoreductase [Thermodesulfobacteriota bacterium]|nr:SDR family oxidoreductase [Thermodesulfobacteriota bacterium]
MKKAAFITGAAERLGKAMALALAGMGYDIALHYNSSEKGARKTADEIKALGRKCGIFKADLYDIKGIKPLTARVFRVFPNCSLLINNASIFENRDFMEVTEESFNREFALNFKAPFFLSQEFSRQKSAEIIVNMLDTRVSRIEPGHFVYNLSKKALRDFTLMAARALGPKIRVNGICPGPIFPPPGKGPKYLKRISGNTPLGKPGHPDYVISALKYIIDNSYVTGECLYVDGGQHLG